MTYALFVTLYGKAYLTVRRLVIQTGVHTTEIEDILMPFVREYIFWWHTNAQVSKKSNLVSFHTYWQPEPAAGRTEMCSFLPRRGVIYPASPYICRRIPGAPASRQLRCVKSLKSD